MGTIQPARFLTDTGQIRAGVVRNVQIPNPAAGAEFKVTVPSGVMWRIATGQATLTTAVTVSTRIPQIQLTSQGVNVGVYTGTETDPASTTAFVTFSQTLPSAAAASGSVNSVIALPTYTLAEGDTLASLTAGIEATDQYSAITILVEEFYFTNPQLSEIARVRAELDRDIAMAEYEQAEQAGG